MRLDSQVDLRWRAILGKVSEMEKTRAFAYRSSSWTSHDGRYVMCVAGFRTQPDDGTRELFHISCDQSLEVKVEGPYIDSHDQYWAELHEKYKNSPRSIRVGDQHYVVERDSKNPGQGDGHGGRLFKIHLYDDEQALQLQHLGYNVERRLVDYGMKLTKYVLTTRNLWAQSTIPPKFRELLPPNAEFINDVEVYGGLDDE